MIKTILIDDEPLARSILLEYLQSHPDFEVVAECNDGFEGVKAIQQHKPDLVFLDIQMPKLTGFEMLELLDDQPHIIFTTAFDEFAIKAFEKNAIDYLLKPISPDRFEKSLDKFRSNFTTSTETKAKKTSEQLQESMEEQGLERIVVKNGSQIKIIPVQQINFLEAYDDYVKIHTTEGMFLKNKTMSSFEKQLDAKQFVRIHRSFMIKVDQLAKIEPMEKDSYIAILHSGDKVNISKSGYARLKQVIGI
ncbi:LytR/AlgR family response regulator transcription factor [Sphingobacterium corticibacter]|uniref:DNA-binding response regulator n=1 Tax=Sphingobacterium corticibacter TaxID=2171749 RepID=A0A2T8HLN7_9SPHI|nr:response regulator [Sphingobacterium corticibacter]PVH26354.1 DNA-binding response regulator [Sphingobacterium corticibacter]